MISLTWLATITISDSSTCLWNDDFQMKVMRRNASIISFSLRKQTLNKFIRTRTVKQEQLRSLTNQPTTKIFTINWTLKKAREICKGSPTVLITRISDIVQMSKPGLSRFVRSFVLSILYFWILKRRFTQIHLVCTATTLNARGVCTLRLIALRRSEERTLKCNRYTKIVSCS